MHGPGPKTATNPAGWMPTYPMPITVRDTLALTLKRPGRRDKWRQSRDEALDIWRAAGLRFTVVEEDPARYAPYDVFDGSASVTAFVPRDAIRLVRQLTTEPDKALWYTAGAGGAAFFRPVTVWWKSWWRPSLRAHIAHEVGHCLGMWHWDKGIMGGGWKAADHELASLRDYYG